MMKSFWRIVCLGIWFIVLGSTHGMAQNNVVKTRSGIVVVHAGNQTRAMAVFKYNPENGVRYAEAINAVYKALDGKVSIYSMLIPISIAFYCPEEASEWTEEQTAAIDTIDMHLLPEIHQVNVYDVLSKYRAEPIYSRTDHHWSPLGAYYAASAFARQAGVPFLPLKNYDKRIVHNFVGTMYNWSKDIAVKRAPEDFVYYIPQDSDYDASFIKYRKMQNGTIEESAPVVEPLLKSYKDGSGAAYCTFLGGDNRTVTISTRIGNGRKLLILKDSFGNALPTYLLSSFEKICVIDFRYYRHNLLQFVRDYGITDILFAHNMQHAYASGTARAYHKLLTVSE